MTKNEIIAQLKKMTMPAEKVTDKLSNEEIRELRRVANTSTLDRIGGAALRGAGIGAVIGAPATGIFCTTTSLADGASLPVSLVSGGAIGGGLGGLFGGGVGAGIGALSEAIRSPLRRRAAINTLQAHNIDF